MSFDFKVELELVLGLVVALFTGAGAYGAYSRRMGREKIEIHRLLDGAWDLMGGAPGLKIISEFAPENILVQAERLVKEALVIRPKYPPSIYVWGVLSEARKKYDQAERAYRSCILRADIKSSYLLNAYRCLGRLYIHTGRPEDAKLVYEESIARNINKAESLYHLGVACMEIKQLRSALDYFHESVKDDPKYGRSYVNLVGVYTLLGQTDLAEKYLMLAQENNAVSADLFMNAAAMYKELGDMENTEQMLGEYEKQITDKERN